MTLSKIWLRGKKDRPFPVDWTSTTADVGEGTILASTNTQTILGIGFPITLKLQFSTSSGTTGTMSYSLNNATGVGFSDNDTLVVKNGDTLKFFRSVGAQAGSVTTVTVINVSDNNTTLDTFTMNAFL
jgi:hypothetical protein